MDSSSCIINSLLEGDVSIGTKCLVTNSRIHGDVHINTESFISGLVVKEFDKVGCWFIVLLVNCIVYFLKI